MANPRKPKITLLRVIDMSRCIFGHIFWHSIWHSIGQRFWHSIRHSFWHIIWHSIWHSYLAFYLTFLSGIISDILSSILSDIFSSVEVRRGPQRSCASSWGPARPTAIKCRQMPSCKPTAIRRWQVLADVALGGPVREMARRREKEGRRKEVVTS